MTIRKAKPGDLATVTDLTRRAYEHYVPIIGGEPMPMGEDYAPRIADGAGLGCWRTRAATAGLIVLEHREDALFIFSVAIAPDHQGKGLGQRLLSYAEDVARRHGLRKVALFTNAKMERNIAIYRRFRLHRDAPPRASDQRRFRHRRHGKDARFHRQTEVC